MCEIQLDVTFPALACSVVSLDAMDISGEQHLDVVCCLCLVLGNFFLCPRAPAAGAELIGRNSGPYDTSMIFESLESLKWS